MKLTRRTFAAALPMLAAVRPAAAAGVTMQLTSTASNDLDQKWMEVFKKDIEAKSNGQITAQVYPGSQLGSAQTTIEGVALGTIQVAINASGLYESLEPRFAVLSIPGLVKTMEQGQKLFTSPAVRARLDKLGRDKGIQVITVLLQSPGAIVTRNPVRKLSDLQGMKIRVPGSAILIDQLKKLGAAPIAMSLGEVLPAFQNGTLDGVFAGATIFTALKYYDVSKHMTVLPETFLAMLGIINSDFVTSLGKQSGLIDEVARQTDAESIPWSMQDVARGNKLWSDNGGQVYTLSDADAKSYLDQCVPVALKSLPPAARADYDALKAAASAA